MNIGPNSRCTLRELHFPYVETRESTTQAHLEHQPKLHVRAVWLPPISLSASFYRARTEAALPPFVEVRFMAGHGPCRLSAADPIAATRAMQAYGGSAEFAANLRRRFTGSPIGFKAWIASWLYQLLAAALVANGVADD